jgi:hypothetical protein
MTLFPNHLYFCCKEILFEIANNSGRLMMIFLSNSPKVIIFFDFSSAFFKKDSEMDTFII